MKRPPILLILLLTIFVGSCEKWTDPDSKPVPGIEDRKYCNDPEAVNYNWGFPGTPDSSVCYYPVDVFAGTYSFRDSVYNDDNSLDSIKSLNTIQIQIVPLTKSRFALVGFCPNDSLRFTALRNALNASSDSTIRESDTSFNYGQFLCRTEDTLVGTITRNQTDTTFSQIYINFTVDSDTAINFHRGTAYKN